MILVGVCCGGQIQALTTLSLIDLLGSSKAPNALSIQIGGYKPHGMNNLIKDARQINATHLLNIDADMTFPPDALDLLLAQDKDIIGANYRQRGNHENQNTPISVTKFIGDGPNGYKEVLSGDFPTETFECAAVGLGLTLINMRVFEDWDLPFHTVETEEIHSTEDIVFCNEARERGFKVFCDPTLNMGHIGQFIY
jgi:hypothetical protein